MNLLSGSADGDNVSPEEEKGMGCVLEVYGEELDVDSLLSQIRLKPCHVQWKGQRRFGPKSRVADHSGFSVVTSEASEENLQRHVSAGAYLGPCNREVFFKYR
jgi:hypothetical protein